MTRRSAWTLGRSFGLLSTAMCAVCWSPDDPPAPPPGNPPPPEPPKPFAVFPDQASFQSRLDREARALLKEKYGLNEKELDERLERAKRLEEAEAERLKAQQTTEQRLETEKQEALAAKAKAEAEAAEARRQAEVTGLCARMGLKNVDYAIYEATRAGKSGAELEAHFNEQLKDESKKSAFGLAVAPITEVPKGPNTAPIAPPGGNPPPPPPPGGGAPPEVDVMKLSPREFQQHLLTKHGA